MNFGIAMIWGVAIGSVFGFALDNLPLGMGVGAGIGVTYALFSHPKE